MCVCVCVYWRNSLLDTAQCNHFHYKRRGEKPYSTNSNKREVRKVQ